MKGWEVKKLHQNCKECAELVAAAIEHANRTDGDRSASQYLSEDRQSVDHQAEVTRK